MRVINAHLAVAATHPDITVGSTAIAIVTEYKLTGLSIGIQVLVGDILVSSGEAPTGNGNIISEGDYMEFNAGNTDNGNDLRVIRSGLEDATIQIWVYEGA